MRDLHFANVRTSDNSQSGVNRPPYKGGDKSASMCALSVVLVIVGGISIFAGLIAGLVAAQSYSTESMTWVYIIGGLLSGLFDFALAVIVDACQKYRKAHKG